MPTTLEPLFGSGWTDGASFRPHLQALEILGEYAVTDVGQFTINLEKCTAVTFEDISWLFNWQKGLPFQDDKMLDQCQRAFIRCAYDRNLAGVCRCIVLIHRRLKMLV